MNKAKSVYIVIGVIIAAAGLIFGGLYWQESQKQKVVETGKKSEKPASSKIDTSNWKTYRNEKYGFEVKYPNSWYFGEIISQKVFTPGVGFVMTDYAAVFGLNRELPPHLGALQGYGVTIRVQVYDGNLQDLNEFEKKSSNEISKEPLTVNGKQGFKIEYRASLPYKRGVPLAGIGPGVSDPYHVIEWRFEDGKKTFRFILHDRDNTKENEDIYWFFVNSFKFIPLEK